MDIARRSVEVILAGQSRSGGYVACPNFEQYRYSWFRDGSFIADAMREIGQVQSADRFFDWCAHAILSRPTGPWDARYTLDGLPDASSWPKLQIDGLGLFLGALRRRGNYSRWVEPAGLVTRWLEHHWAEPSVDWWEEREGIHAATLWCVGDGLGSDEIRREALAHADDRVDGSLLFIGTPEIVERIEQSLLVDGGVHRHLEDEYYGGGQWLLGDARACLAWIEAHAGPNGDLPEQSQDHLLRPERYQPWVEKWGEPPSPLLWSHAMYLRLHHALRDRR